MVYGRTDLTDELYTLTFNAGDTNSSTTDISVLILSDDFVEEPETFDLSISGVSSAAMASAGSPDSATVTITDDDSKFLWDSTCTCEILKLLLFISHGQTESAHFINGILFLQRLQ